MRKVFSVALMAGMLCLVGMTKEANATVTVTMVWGLCTGAGCGATGTDVMTMTSGSGQTLRLDIFLTHDNTDGLKGHGFSLAFDTDLANELNFNTAMAQAEWGGTDVNPHPVNASAYSPIAAGVTGTIESTGATAGRINTYESGSLTGVLPRTGQAYSNGTFTLTAPGTYRVGQAFFIANGAVTDGADIFAGIFNTGVDDILNGAGGVLPLSGLSFGTATLNLIPEPGTVSLLGLGLVGLVLAGRRSRRS